MAKEPDSPETGAGTDIENLDAAEMQEAFGPEVTPEPVKGEGEPKAEPEPAKVEPEPSPAAVADSGAPAKGEAAPSEFDSEAFAKANEIDPELVKSCKTPEEALQAVVKRMKYHSELAGRQANEIGTVRQEIAGLRKLVEERAGKESESPPAKTEPEAVQGPDYGQFVKWHKQDPEKANEWYRDWSERDPVGASLWLQGGYQQATVGPALKRTEVLEKGFAEVRDAPRRMRLDAEFQEFQAEHKDGLKPAFAAIVSAAADLGVDPGVDDRYPLSDLHALGVLKASEPAQHQEAMGLIAQGMAIGPVLELVALRAKQVLVAAGAPERVAATVKTAKGAAAVTSRGSRPVMELDNTADSDAVIDEVLSEGEF